MMFVRIFMLLSILLSLSGCVYLDIAAQDSAVPIHPHKVASRVYFSNGIDLDDAVFNSEGQDNVGNAVISNFKIGFAVHPKADAIFTFSSTDGHGTGSESMSYTERHETQQVKLGVKYLLNQKGKSYYSILPSLYRVSSTYTEHDDYLDIDESFLVNGLEMEALYSYRGSEHICSSLIARANLHNVKKRDEGVRESNTGFNCGLRANLLLSWSILQLCTEVGVELVPIKNHQPDLNPTISVGLGLKL